MALLKRDDILKVADIRKEVVEVKPWNGSVMVWGMSGAERDLFEESITNRSGESSKMNFQNLRARLCAWTIRDPDTGDRLFEDKDIVTLGKKSAEALQIVFEISQRLSGITKTDVRSLVKNSVSGQSEDSGSA